MKIYSKTILSVSVSLLSAGLLSACGHPNAMPSGYTHHHNVKNAVDVSAADSVPLSSTYIAAPENQALSLVDVDRAVDDMLRKITARAGVPPKPVYILKPENPTPFYNAVDNALRTSMRDLGYAISDMKAGAYGMAYNARALRKPRGTENDGHPNVELMLQAYSNVESGARLLTEQSGNYFIKGAKAQDIRALRHDIDLKKSSVQSPIEPVQVKRQDIIIEEPEIPMLMKQPIIAAPMEEPITPDVDFKSLSSGQVSSDYNIAPATRDNVSQSSSLPSISKQIEY